LFIIFGGEKEKPNTKKKKNKKKKIFTKTNFEKKKRNEKHNPHHKIFHQAPGPGCAHNTLGIKQHNNPGWPFSSFRNG